MEEKKGVAVHVKTQEEWDAVIAKLGIDYYSKFDCYEDVGICVESGSGGSIGCYASIGDYAVWGCNVISFSEYIPQSPKPPILTSAEIFETLTNREQLLFVLDGLKETKISLSGQLEDVEESIKDLEKQIVDGDKSIDMHNKAVNEAILGTISIESTDCITDKKEAVKSEKKPCLLEVFLKEENVYDEFMGYWSADEDNDQYNTLEEYYKEAGATATLQAFSWSASTYRWDLLHDKFQDYYLDNKED